MQEEIYALEQNKTWTITTLSASNTPIGFKWVYKLKTQGWWFNRKP